MAQKETSEGSCSGKPITVVVADDHPAIRDGTARQLERCADIAVVGTAATGTEALDLSRRLQPTVLVLDVRMPGTQTVDVVKQVRTLPTPPYVLMLSGFDDIEQVVRFLNVGASGYALKEEPEQRFVAAVRAVASGQRWLSAAIEAKLLNHTLHAKASSAPLILSAWDRELLQLIADGKTNQQIGLALGISAKAIEKRLEKLFEHLGVQTRTEAAVLAVRKGWI